MNRWRCQTCSTLIDGFDACWNCGTDRNGIPDPEFAKESDAIELADDPEVPRVQCSQCEYRGKVLFSSQSKSTLEWIIAGLISIPVSQRLWIQFCHKKCPRCEADESNLKPWAGEITSDDEQIWQEKKELETIETRRQQRNVYMILGSLAVGSLLLWLALKA